MKVVILLFATHCLSLAATAQVKLPGLVRDSMVLQRDTKVKLWGWAGKAEKIHIKFNGKSFKTSADAEGNWAILLPPMKAGGPYTMNITAGNKITLKDILIGDVWICSGQSNMVLPMERVKEKYPDEIAGANYPEIRHFFIPTLTDLQKPKNDLPTGYWKPANPTEVLLFSATAYFFAKTIYEKYHVPIGLINASVGGTPVEAWISEDGLKTFPELVSRIEKNKDTANVNSMNRAAAAANAANSPKKQDDIGLNGPLKWYDTAYVPKGWHNIHLPGYWEDQGIRDLNGVVWYRREIDVPALMTGIPAKIFMGRIVDADELYINGKWIGNVTYQYPPRKYEITAGILKPGKNVITIRVSNYAAKGGFVPDKPYYLTARVQNIDLKGDWLYKVGQVFPPEQIDPPISLQNQPTALYNAMIAPLLNYTVKGFLWYQGEANTTNPSAYNELLTALITAWRNQWKLGDIPFLYVQLPNFMETNYLPSESKWAELRESQLKTLSVPNTGMAVTIDLGEWNDIHPLNKKDVGYRLAVAAEKIAFGSDVVFSGPLYESSKVDGNKIIITFTNAGSGLITNDGEELRQFAIAGMDKKFVWAKAVIKGNTIMAWSENVPEPKYIRYAWADNPDGANLYNKEGLPASPFRTDTPFPEEQKR